jgi:hypothetical protein
MKCDEYLRISRESGDADRELITENNITSLGPEDSLNRSPVTEYRTCPTVQTELQHFWCQKSLRRSGELLWEISAFEATCL